MAKKKEKSMSYGARQLQTAQWKLDTALPRALDVLIAALEATKDGSEYPDWYTRIGAAKQIIERRIAALSAIKHDAAGGLKIEITSEHAEKVKENAKKGKA